MCFLFRPTMDLRLVWLVGLTAWTSLNAQEYNPPEGYYDGAEGLLGSSLRSALHDIIDGQNTLDYYDDLPVLWGVTEADPENPNNILLLYSGTSVSRNSSLGGWNREHTWPQSYGADTGSAFSDAHHIFPCNSSVNTARSNYIFDYVVAGTPVFGAPDCLVDETRRIFEPRVADRGLLARAELYMDLRYAAEDVEGNLVLSDFPSTTSKRFARLTTLLEWNRQYPPTEREQMRNHVIYNGFFASNKLIWQGNRNPFIDFPELADALHTASSFVSWGSWRITHFTFADLLDDAISADLADPEDDRLSNLMELSMNSDPLLETSTGLPNAAYDPDLDQTTFSFSRLRQAERSYLSYRVETSQFPLDEGSWTVQDLTESNTSVEADGFLDSVQFSDGDMEAPLRTRHFRLRVAREVSPGNFVETVFDRQRFEEPDSNSLFLYAADLAAEWKESDWYGLVSDKGYPWIYNTGQNWQFACYVSEQDVYLHDRTLGWIWTGYGVYPNLYSLTNERWYHLEAGTNFPSRHLYDYTTGQFIREDTLNL